MNVPKSLGVLTVMFLMTLSAISIHSQTASSNSITPELLAPYGLHLPTQQTVPGLIKYQTDLPTHQELKVEWKSIAGRQEPISKKEAGTLPLTRDFALVERKHSLPNGAGCHYFYDLAENTIVVVSATATGEIRSLVVCYDPRQWHGEDLRPGKPPERWDVVFPNATFFLSLPDDPSIAQIVFFKPRYSGRWRLDELGTVELPDEEGTAYPKKN